MSSAYAKLNLGRFFATPEYMNICREYNVDNIGQIHPGLYNEDSLGYLIRKQRLLQYPKGMHLAGRVFVPGILPAYAHIMLGVIREQQCDLLRPIAEQCIREIVYLNDAHDEWFILCSTDALLRDLHNAKFVQMDLSFKNVAGKPNIFSIVGWDEVTQRKLCICRPYTKLTFSRL